MGPANYDAIIVRAGFSGIYQLYKLRQLGFTALLVDSADEIGGTWYYNRYPGASSDVHSWNQYLTQPEILAYLKHVVTRHDLGRDIQLNTEFVDAVLDEIENAWNINLSTGKPLTARYLFTTLGPLARRHIPDIKNFDSFKKEVYHTSAWPKSHNFFNKRVGVIGNGSTGSQILVALSKEAKHVTSFQRTPQWNVPNGNRLVWNSGVAFGFQETTTRAFDVSDKKRQRVFQEQWDRGNGFQFLFGTFSDIALDEKPIRLLRILLRARSLRFLVSLKETPFIELTPNGVKTSDGVEHELDILVLATGFDAITGNYNRVTIRGLGGRTLSDQWADTPTTYLGVSVPSFPNLFTIMGPNVPFTNTPPSVEAQVDFVADLVKFTCKNGIVEATPEAENEWTQLSNQVVEGTLYPKVGGWVFGDNIPGKKKVLFWLGGLKKYREIAAEVAAQDYAGKFKINQV
ncbi:hypothetical protein B0O99DRAFT_740800 [Bisporella sp. PMI_857]|nr:hypothetical protein B0O99DRAFT_740800 [Bisporella sp. PMI_857]